MTILSHFVDMAGFHRYLIEVTTGINVEFKFLVEKTEQELEVIASEYVTLHQYDNVIQLLMRIEIHVDILVAFVRKVKQTPSMTLNQYNTYLGSLTWYDASIIRFFVFKLAVGLAERHEVDLTDMTETQVLLAVRNWLVNTPAKRIAKIVFGYIIDF